ncbi:PLP-dependent aminotransferase family protein [Ammoniphilus sp. CFH 90114]|uniref:MocR-like pyridoxine biosynthesis transcription factor PdxR n=1 Tax=Ammoniphilus sp. CFH 90114 TaxID=2493665 RepID=UPI00100DC485|nr:PLP-dependent aminotransferase family protein [Ammoniphilus sp. CFH 90114]RXT04943.1 PLP-dependent aminotransferase family protein [Ammoniphilus sp. CFH 90114]
MDFLFPLSDYEKKYKYKYLALYHALKDAIHSGTLVKGTKLPSSREFGKVYSFSRGVVGQVYDMLAAEGYISGTVGSGTYVCYPFVNHSNHHQPLRVVAISEWAKRLEAIPLRQRIEKHATIDFSIGYPDLSAFPSEEWNRVMYSMVRELTSQSRKEAFQSAGHYPLREAIAYYLRRARGINTNPENIVIVGGSMQAIALIAQLLINPGDQVVIENPSYTGIHHAIMATGGIPLPADVDDQGIVPQDWKSHLVFVTPSRQFPTGVVSTLERRLELLAWANKQNALIVEDDYDSEFRREGRPIEPLKVLDREDRVLYIGTFSKTLLPDLRIGYAVLPSSLIVPFMKARQLFDPHPSSIVEQRTVAAFMNSGQYERHLRRMKRIYSRKYEVMSVLLEEQLGDLFEWVPSDGGLHVYGWWKGKLEEYLSFKQSCSENGVTWTDASPYFYGASPPAACLGFSHPTFEEIREGIKIMGRVDW